MKYQSLFSTVLEGSVVGRNYQQRKEIQTRRFDKMKDILRNEEVDEVQSEIKRSR